MPRFEHERDEAHRLVLDRHHVHLRARDHDVADCHLGNLQRTFDDRQRVGVEELSLEGTVQQVEELLAILRLARQKSRQPLEERRLVRDLGVTIVVAGGCLHRGALVRALWRAA